MRNLFERYNEKNTENYSHWNNMVYSLKSLKYIKKIENLKNLYNSVPKNIRLSNDNNHNKKIIFKRVIQDKQTKINDIHLFCDLLTDVIN